MSKQQSKLEKLISEGRVVRVEASQLSINDEFMQYNPNTKQEKAFKEMLSKVIKSGPKDFYRPVLDPSFLDDDAQDYHICYEFKKKPAVGKSYHWWTTAAKNFDESCRIGTRFEYVAFLGVLIKELVKEGWKTSEAWKCISVDSKKIGHYADSKESKEKFELTGSRQVGVFYDLANTGKILAFDKEVKNFWIATAYYMWDGKDFPLAYLMLCRSDTSCSHLDKVGWLVFDHK